jgi:hypothetical protein
MLATSGLFRLRQHGRNSLLLWFWQLCCQNQSKKRFFRPAAGEKWFMNYPAEPGFWERAGAARSQKPLGEESLDQSDGLSAAYTWKTQ